MEFIKLIVTTVIENILGRRKGQLAPSRIRLKVELGEDNIKTGLRKTGKITMNCRV